MVHAMCAGGGQLWRKKVAPLPPELAILRSVVGVLEFQGTTACTESLWHVSLLESWKHHARVNGHQSAKYGFVWPLWTPLGFTRGYEAQECNRSTHCGRAGHIPIINRLSAECIWHQIAVPALWHWTGLRFTGHRRTDRCSILLTNCHPFPSEPEKGWGQAVSRDSAGSG